MAPQRTLNRDILWLAVPAFGSLVVEPIFLALDSAMVGHLGVAELAGLGIASSVLQTLVGLMVFLAYATTPAVARLHGAGDDARAVSRGIDGMWLAVGIGAVLAVAGYALAPWAVGLFGPTPEVAAEAEAYLGLSMWGLPAMLVVFAATGLLRGLQDTVTPLWIAGLGFAANALLNWLFMYGLGWGIAGSAAGTVAAQWGMVVAYAGIAARLAKRHGSAALPSRAGLGGTALTGGWLLLRTVALRAGLLLTVAAATALGTEELAGWQIVFTIGSTAAFALDALAIAAQALIGKYLGSGDEASVRYVLRRTVAWGAWCGVAIGLLIAGLAPVLGVAFTGEWDMSWLTLPALVAMGALQPLAGVVYVLDGVLMGANDARYLALAGAVNLVPFLAYLLILLMARPAGSWGLVGVAIAFFGVLMGMRAWTLGRRVRGSAWLRQAG
ncbi:MATE family efflux transporter [Microbacterium sp. ZXX196]|uniref:MATE family efflux transporter n=1 Tax=Microbacterium sp. ZXX196 TaxID=2609291 RepID=UPI0012B8D426|nr:MATE family efflux transporter [Microbacterium sp. ZXX196]MTE24671.1 MATE family efflux transporter [Microbacterium sp. ZXX196]